MIVGFRVGNFRSFLGVQACSFVASSDNTHAATHCIETNFKSLPRLTRTAAIFGPNASGKTNLLIALRTMRELVVHSASYSDAQFAETYTPFRADKSERIPTLFSIELLLRGTRYRYAFAYDALRITAESLYVHYGRKSQRWFGRQWEESGVENWIPFSPSLAGPRDTWRRETRPTALFLTVAGRQHAVHIRDILHWFEHELAIVLASDAPNPSVFAERVSDPEFRARALGILHTMDLQIDDVRVMQTAAPADSSISAPVPTVEFLHRREQRSPVWLDFSHEAAGIQRLVHILGPLLDAIETGAFIAIDEVDRSLHPLVARFLIQLVNDPQISRRRAQMLINSHNINLMDLEILRRDEIWLIELDGAHASRLSALSQQKPRKNERVAKNYLQGDFGALPDVSWDKRHDVMSPSEAIEPID